MDLGIEGRRAIVCASSRGLGKACALSLARNGVHVTLNGRDESVLAVTAEVRFTGLALGDLVVVAILNLLIAAIAVIALRAIDLRFGEPERVAW